MTIPCAALHRDPPAAMMCAGEAAWRDIFTNAGFSRFRRATETPFNIILEARP